MFKKLLRIREMLNFGFGQQHMYEKELRVISSSESMEFEAVERACVYFSQNSAERETKCWKR